MPTPSLDDDAISSLERATLDAVAPPAVQAMDGWLLPFDTSTIGRAKSAVPLRHHDVAPAHIGAIECLYAEHGLQAVFRIADVPGLYNLQAELTRRGYQAQQPTLVQVGTVAAMRAICQGQRAHVVDQPSAAWSSVYLAEGFDPVDAAHRVQALSRSPHVVYAHVEESGRSVAAGTAALSQGWASIHGMRTVPASRGHGLAARILGALADTATQRGMDRVFLQVEQGNAAALALYARAGFATVWRYHYWRRT